MKKRKNFSWVILNLDENSWYWIDRQPDEAAALNEYLHDVFGDDETKYSFDVQVMKVTSWKEFQVKINEFPKFQTELTDNGR